MIIATLPPTEGEMAEMLPVEVHSIKIDENMSIILHVEDDSGWSCSLERWFSQRLKEWYTAVSVYNQDGMLRMNNYFCSLELTRDSACKMINLVKVVTNGQ